MIGVDWLSHFMSCMNFTPEPFVPICQSFFLFWADFKFPHRLVSGRQVYTTPFLLRFVFLDSLRNDAMKTTSLLAKIKASIYLLM